MPHDSVTLAALLMCAAVEPTTDDAPTPSTSEPPKVEAPAAGEAPNIDAQPSNEIMVNVASNLILSGIAAQGGDMAEADACKHAPSFKPEEINAAIARLFIDGLIEKEGAKDCRTLLVLTCAGWTETLARASKAASEALEKKDDEIRALHKHIVTEKELAEEVKACEAEVESAKATVSACKEALATANTKLAAFVRGDVQTSFLDTPTAPTGDVTAYEQGFRTWDPKKAEAINPYPADPQMGDWQRGYDAAKAQSPKLQDAFNEKRAGVGEYPASKFYLDADTLKVRLLEEGTKAEIRAGNPKVGVKEHTVSLFERDYLVMADARGFGPESFQCLPLYSKDEWASMGHEAKYGRCVDGVDQTTEARDQRQAGGEFCGKVVKFCRSKAVIGPVDEAIWLACEDVATPAADEPEPEGDGQDD